MKTQLEIQKAHDMLTSVILGDVPNPFDPEKKFAGDTVEERLMVENCAVLCWVLGHDHNPTFQKNLDTINTTLADMGYTLERREN